MKRETIQMAVWRVLLAGDYLTVQEIRHTLAAEGRRLQIPQIYTALGHLKAKGHAERHPNATNGRTPPYRSRWRKQAAE